MNIDELVWVRFVCSILNDPLKLMQNHFYPIAKTYAIELFKKKAGVDPYFSELPSKYRSMDRNDLNEWSCVDQSDSHQEYEECVEIFNNFIFPTVGFRLPDPQMIMNIEIIDSDKFYILKKASPLLRRSNEHELDIIYRCQQLFRDLKKHCTSTLSQLSNRFNEEITLEQIESMDYEKKVLIILKTTHFSFYIKDSAKKFESSSSFITGWAEKLDKLSDFGYDKNAQGLMTFMESITYNGVPLFKEFPGSLDEIDEFLSSSHYLPTTKLIEMMGLYFEGDQKSDLDHFNLFLSSVIGLLEFANIREYSDLLMDIKELFKVGLN